MLSAMDEADSKAILEENRRRLDAQKERDSSELENYIAQARQKHCVLKSTVHFPEGLSLAVPVLDDYGAPVLALSMSSLAARMSVRLAACRVIAPQLIGLLSDVVAANSAEPRESLRIVLYGCAFTGFWASAHFWRAARNLNKC